jgi:AmmeMemoRadiSam system protein A
MNKYVSLAKKAIESYILEGKIIDSPKDFSKEKAGVFVTIMKEKELRGCIGTYLPTKDNIAEEIIQNAISVATEDYRFGKIKKEELPHLSYEVSILSEPELVKDVKELNPRKFGVIVKTTSWPQRSGLLLPDLEGVDTVEDQISICCQKGRINPREEETAIYKFTVKKYE